MLLQLMTMHDSYSSERGNVNTHHLDVQDSVESADLPEIRVYKRRWYILALFCAMACHQVGGDNSN